MSTHAIISRAMPAGTVESIFCHCEGYPHHTGKMLLNHYNQEWDRESLFALGDIIFLGKQCVTFQEEFHIDFTQVEQYRVPVKIHKNLLEFKKYARHSSAEWIYHHTGSRWVVLPKQPDFQDLKTFLESVIL